MSNTPEEKDEILSENEIGDLIKDFDLEEVSESDQDEVEEEQPNIEETDEDLSDKEDIDLSDDDIENLIASPDTDDTEQPSEPESDESLSADESLEVVEEELTDIVGEDIDLSDEEIESLIAGFDTEGSTEPAQFDESLEVADVDLSSTEIESLINVFEQDASTDTTQYDDQLSNRNATLEILDTAVEDVPIDKEPSRLSVSSGVESKKAWQKKLIFFQDLCTRFEVILRTYITSLLRVSTRAEKLPIGRSTYRDVVNSSFNSDKRLCIIMFPFEYDTDVYDIIELDLNLVFFMVDLYLGGDASSIPNKNEITDFERIVISKMIGDIRTSMSQIWHPELELIDRPPKVLSFRDLADSSYKDQSVMTFPFRMTLQNGDQSPINGRFVVHISDVIKDMDEMYIDVRDKKATSKNGMKDASKASMEEKVMEIPLWLQVRFPARKITFGELLKLKEGDLIKLGVTIRDKVNVKLQEKDKFHGKLVLAGNMKAVEICSGTYSDYNSIN